MCRCSPHKMEGLEEEARTGGWVGPARTLQKYVTRGGKAKEEEWHLRMNPRNEEFLK